jgi:hypothetical protein
MRNKKAESGRIKLPRGTTANERAKNRIGKQFSVTLTPKGARAAAMSFKEARAGLIPSEETDGLNVANNVCQNCRKEWREDQLEEITHGIWERVSPGELMPSGQCPDCGSLCTPIQKPIPVIVRLTVIGGVAEAYKVPKGIRVEVHDYDCDAIADAPDIHKDKNGDRYILKVWEGK